MWFWLFHVCIHSMLFPLWKVHVLCILTPPWYIELIFSYFYLLNTCVDLSKSSWHDPHYLLIDRAPLACFSCVIHIFHFCCPFYVHSILFSCFSYWSMVPCSPCSLCVSFLFVYGQVFLLSMPFDNCVKKGRNLRFECYSSGE